MLFNKILRNASKLLCGNGFNVIAGLATAALSARALGPHDYGILVFIFAYELIIGQLLTFNAWQAIITFGSEACRDCDEAALGQLIKAALLLDLAGAIGSFILGTILCNTVVALLGWPQSIAELLQLYCLLLLFRSGGAPAGALRLFDRFGLLAFINIFNSLLRLVGVVYAFAAGLGLYGFVLINLLTTIGGQLFLFLAAGQALGWQRVMGFMRQPLSGLLDRFPGFWKYIWTTNLHATVKLLSREADQLIVAACATPASLGLFRIARQFARILPLATDPLYQSLFPELSKLRAAGNLKEFSALIRKSAIFGLVTGLAGWLVFLVLGSQLIGLAFGPEYLAAHTTSLIFMLALVIALAGLPLQPAMLAIGQPEVSFKINLVSTIIYLAVLLPMTLRFSINGAAATYILYYVIWSILMTSNMHSHLKHQ